MGHRKRYLTASPRPLRHAPISASLGERRQGAILLNMHSGNDTRRLPFDSIYRHGYVRVAAAVPRVRIGDPAFNAERTIALARQAHEQDVALVVFPELGLAAYTSEDLFRQDALLEATLAGDRAGARRHRAARAGASSSARRCAPSRASSTRPS